MIACGEDDADEEPDRAVLHGETEVGMALEAEPAIEPADDPALASLDAYRERIGAPPVVYVRVLADNGDGASRDQGRPIRFAEDPETLLTEGGIQVRFTCDALEYEWVPRSEGESDDWERLRSELCDGGRPEPVEIEPGESRVYYLFVEQTVETRDLDRLRAFGPRDEELVPQGPGS